MDMIHLVWSDLKVPQRYCGVTLSYWFWSMLLQAMPAGVTARQLGCGHQILGRKITSEWKQRVDISWYNYMQSGCATFLTATSFVEAGDLPRILSLVNWYEFAPEVLVNWYVHGRHDVLHTKEMYWNDAEGHWRIFESKVLSTWSDVGNSTYRVGLTIQKDGGL